MAHQANTIGTRGVHAAKEVCRGGLAARKQNRVGRDLLVDMALARAARAQLAEVVVMLDQRNHALNKVQALALGELVRLVAGRAQQHVEPFVACEVLAALDHLVQIEVGHLDGSEAHHAKRRILGPALLFLGAVARRNLVAKDIGPKLIELGVGTAVLDAHDAPDSALQDLAVVAHVLCRNHKRLDGEVCKRRHVDVLVFIESRRELVDDGVLPKLANLGLDALGLVGAHVVFGKDLANTLKTLFHAFFVVGGTVHAQQILEHKRGHVGAALHKGRKVLAHDLAAKVAQ